MKRKTRLNSEVNTSSTADIAFLLLVFFLVTSSIDQEYGIKSSISKPFELPDSVTISNHEVMLNNAGHYLLNGNACSQKDLAESLTAVFNTKNGVKNVVVVKTEREVAYPLFISALNEVKKGINLHYNNQAQLVYNSSYPQLSDKNKKNIQERFPVVLAEEILEL